MKIKRLFNVFQYFGRFSFIGLITTGFYFILTNIILFFGLAQTIVASNFSYILCIVISFLGHSNFTFSVKSFEIYQFKKFLTLSIIGLIISNFIIILNTQLFYLSSFLVIFTITLIIPIINFFALKYWVFKT